MLIISELANIVQSSGGRVKPCRSAIISNRTITEKVKEETYRIVHFERLLAGDKGNEYTRNALDAARAELEKLEAVSNEPVKVTHTTYITFTLNGFYYYYQVDDNPFVEFYYTKTPLKGDKYSRDACLDEDPKKWLDDRYFRYDCTRADITEVAQRIFRFLCSSKATPIHREKQRQRVPNTYDGDYHYEEVYTPERIGKIDF